MARGLRHFLCDPGRRLAAGVIMVLASFLAAAFGDAGAALGLSCGGLGLACSGMDAPETPDHPVTWDRP